MSIPACIGHAPAAPASARAALAALSLAMLLSSLGTSSANVALPAIATAFDTSFGAVQWVVLGYLVTVTALVVGAGRLGDLVGRRRLLMLGLFAFTFASALCAFAPGLGVLVAARVEQGIGAAIMMALTTAFAADVVPRERVGRALGLLGSMSAIGTALGPSLGGVLVATAGWRTVFLANVPLGALALLLAWRALPRDTAASTHAGRRFDIAGSVVLAATLAAYAMAMTAGQSYGDATSVGLIVAAIIGAIAFTRIEAHAANPLVRLSLLREQGLGALLAANALVATIMMATLVVGPFHLARALGLGPAAVGCAMAVGPLVAAIAGVPAGRLVDRFGSATTMRAALALVGTGCALLATLPSAAGLAGYLVPLAIATAGYALFQAANGVAAMTIAGTERRGIVAGLVGLSRNLGLVSGASALGAVFASASGGIAPDASPAAIAAGTHATFAAATLLVLVAAIVVVLANRVKPGV